MAVFFIPCPDVYSCERRSTLMDGFFIDDPMLALIARFAGCCSDTTVSEEVFQREQVLQVRAYIESFPPDQNQERALEWISRNAG